MFAGRNGGPVGRGEILVASRPADAPGAGLARFLHAYQVHPVWQAHKGALVGNGTGPTTRTSG